MGATRERKERRQHMVCNVLRAWFGNFGGERRVFLPQRRVSLLMQLSRSQLCGAYYYVWVILLPRLGSYEIVEEIEELGGGVRLRKLVRRPLRRVGEEAPLLSSEGLL